MYLGQLEDVLRFSMPKGKIAGFFAEAIQVIHLLAFINHCGGRDFHLAFSFEQCMNRLLPFLFTVTQRIFTKQYESLKESFPYPIAYPIFYRTRLFGGIGYNFFNAFQGGGFNDRKMTLPGFRKAGIHRASTRCTSPVLCLVTFAMCTVQSEKV